MAAKYDNKLKYVPGMNLKQTVKHLFGDRAKMASKNLIHVRMPEEEYNKSAASYFTALALADGRDWGGSFKAGVAEFVPHEE